MSIVFKHTKSGAPSSRGATVGWSLEQLKNHQIKRDSVNRTIGITRRKLGSFGIVDSKGNVNSLTWVTSGIRDHGYVGEVTPMSRCNKDMLESMFKGWN